MKHPARFTPAILDVIQEHVYGKVLDPFAGTGRIHSLTGCETYGVEIEPEWATMHPRTIVGNALQLPFKDKMFDCIATSPCYGNRLADSHNARDSSYRRSYTHDIGRRLHPANAGVLQWGQRYRDFHVDAWHEAVRVLKPEGLFVLNISNHIRNGKEQEVMQWHCMTLNVLGLKIVDHMMIHTPRFRNGANSSARVDGEWVLIFKRMAA